MSNSLKNCCNHRDADELQAGRRIFRIQVNRDGNTVYLDLKTLPISSLSQIEPEHYHFIANCMRLPSSPEGSTWITSVDVIKILSIVVNPHGHQLSISEKNRIRRNIDTLRPLTVGPEDERMSFMLGFPYPQPVNIAKSVKIYEWTGLEGALKKVVDKYVSL